MFFFFYNRNFVSNNYLKIKENNPDFNVVVRECEGADPYLIARYRIIYFF